MKHLKQLIPILAVIVFASCSAMQPPPPVTKADSKTSLEQQLQGLNNPQRSLKLSQIQHDLEERKQELLNNIAQVRQEYFFKMKTDPENSFHHQHTRNMAEADYERQLANVKTDLQTVKDKRVELLADPPKTLYP